MSRVLDSRKSSFALATKKEIEVTHLLSLAYVSLTRPSSHHVYSTTSTNVQLPATYQLTRLTILKV